MRDAIVFSGWTWEAHNVPERLALALAHLGVRVLYCECPVSRFRGSPPGPRQPEKGIFAFRPVFLGQRLNRMPVLRSLQARSLAEQIFRYSDELGLREPVFFYPWMGGFLPLCQEMKKRCFLVHIHMDYGEGNSDAHVSLSDVTLAVPRTVFHKLKARFGEKVRWIPQPVDFLLFSSVLNEGLRQPPELVSIPRPRLGYAGSPGGRLNQKLLGELLECHPDWQFVSFGSAKPLPLPNVHVVPWQPRHLLPHYLGGFDVGFMPYDCYHEERFHCVPLKLYEYFAFGMPVVATPLIHLWEYRDLVYLGDTAEELAAGVRAALEEPRDSPKRRRRMEIAEEHSIENLARRLKQLLPLES